MHTANNMAIFLILFICIFYCFNDRLRRAKDTSLFFPCEALLLLAYSEWTFSYFQQLICSWGIISDKYGQLPGAYSNQIQGALDLTA